MDLRNVLFRGKTMKFIALMLSCLALVCLCGGCRPGCEAGSKASCGGRPACDSGCLSEKSCRSMENGECGKKANCWKNTCCYQFLRTPSPLGNPAVPAAQKIAYAQMGYRCAMDKGMVPVSPRFGVPALDCPWIRSVDPVEKTVCPTSCTDCGPVVTERPTERGYLLTAFDTPRGTRYVMIEAEREFSPATTLQDVEKDFNNLVETLRGLNGKVVVYLTSFPLITPRSNETSRVLRDLEINSFKSALQDKAASVSFVNWQ